MGVEIDWVLNKHREKFSRLLKENVGIWHTPGSITTIRLNECPALKVSREDEKRVFNDPQYWIQMPLLDRAAYNLAKARNINLRIHVFSHQPWPNTVGMTHNARMKIHKQWDDKTLSFARSISSDAQLNNVFDRIRLRIGIPEDYTVSVAWFRLDKRLVLWLRTKLGIRPIEEITKCWLRLYSLDYDELTIEQGNEDVTAPQGHFRNRFYIATQKKIWFFVEDDLDKAIKLAYICDVVFWNSLTMVIFKINVQNAKRNISSR